MARDLKRNSILIVDDEPEIRDVLSIMLAEEGFRVRTAGDGEEALKKIKEAEPDLILLDMNMPKMGGIVFYHNIASAYDGTPRYPVLVLTARHDLKQTFADFQVDGFMTKPFQYDELNRKIVEILEKHYSTAGPAPAAIEAAPAKKRTTSTPSILIMEDDPALFDGLVVKFMNSGYEVLAAKNSRMTLKAATYDNPSAIFIKISNPTVNSPELALAEAIRKIDSAKQIPIVIYPHKSLKISGSFAHHIIETVPGTRVLEICDPDLILSEFEKIIKGR